MKKTYPEIRIHLEDGRKYELSGTNFFKISKRNILIGRIMILRSHWEAGSVPHPLIGRGY
ncbi:hypothetical protein LEP1GSC199_3160 [Leptospira vanthielii serovar Holland str. Waz Holland = ATCC 700522]|uniref:Uncharacterized protein n=1 Tax=Leptospira vanthielii serovar Holland str. Waz Holland = ATCC 700522 TaxID=1218591 RepID=N1W9N1_9LEPT|nr:hypothetical protein LEP1GSC199_3160 [Leptospira vanthielii serovar Holland str. Waz Holland = ATCC 700522]